MLNYSTFLEQKQWRNRKRLGTNEENEAKEKREKNDRNYAGFAALAASAFFASSALRRSIRRSLW